MYTINYIQTCLRRRSTYMRGSAVCTGIVRVFWPRPQFEQGPDFELFDVLRLEIPDGID